MSGRRRPQAGGGPLDERVRRPHGEPKTRRYVSAERLALQFMDDARKQSVLTDSDLVKVSLTA